MKRHYIIPIFVPHKGCPHDCIFCNQKRITGQIEEVSSRFVGEEIDKYLKTIKRQDTTVEVSFFGGSFTGLPINTQVDLLEPAKKAMDERKIDAIRLSTRPDYIDPNILDVLKSYGVSIIELGVQSMDSGVLDISNRGHNVDDVYASSKLIKSYGFTLGLQMMVGLPGDNEDKDLETACRFVEIYPSMVRIYPALVIKDTYMEDMYRRGEYMPLSVDEAVNICSKLYLIFEKAGINIIRIGLQPTDNINIGKDVVSGPFHPSFRELVESKILNDMVFLMYGNIPHRNLQIKINERSLSKLYSNRKKYFNDMLRKINFADIRVIVENTLPVNSIKLESEECSQIMSINDYSYMV